MSGTGAASSSDPPPLERELFPVEPPAPDRPNLDLPRFDLLEAERRELHLDTLADEATPEVEPDREPEIVQAPEVDLRSDPDPVPEPEVGTTAPGRAVVTTDPTGTDDPPADPLDEPIAVDDDATTPPAVAAHTRDGHTGALPTFPALDGVRGVAVLAVVLFDAGLTWAKGGDLGISTLFTLTGFLAVAGLLAERGEGDAVDLRGFWLRRIRRILGPALAVLALAAVFGVVAAAASQREALAGDGIAALASVANWRFILDHQPFGPAYDLSSPVRQFWALSVIGQLLLVVPLLLVGLLGALRWSRERLGWVLGALMLGSVALTLVLADSPNRVLYGTDTRAAELLAGCLLAVVIYDPRITIRLAVPGPIRETINVLGVLAGLGLLAAWWLIAPTSRLMLHGGLAAVAVLSSVVVLAAILPEGPVSHLLSRAPFQWLGRIAIALYLVHWPLFVWIDGARTGLSTYPLLAVRLAVSLVAAVALHLASTRLARREREARAPRRRLAWMAAVATAAVVALLIGVSVTAPSAPATVAAGGDPTTSTPAAAGPVPTVAFYGDALAATLQSSAQAWATQTGQITVIPGVVSTTCGLDREGVRRLVFADEAIPAECRDWETNWAQAIAAGAPDVAVIVTGISELSDHQQGDAAWAAPGDQAYDYQLYLLMTKAVETLSAQGSKVIWINLPAFAPDSGPRSQAKRVDRFNELLGQLATDKAGLVTIADLATWATTNGGQAIAPSTTGFGSAAADRVVEGFLGPAVAAAAAPEPPAGETTPASDGAGPGITVTSTG